MVRVAPELPGRQVSVHGTTLVIHGRSRPRTTYAVTLAGALPDVFGQTLGQDQTVRFTVGRAQPSISAAGESITVLDPAGGSRLSVYSAGVPALQVTVHRVAPGDWPAYRTFLERAQRDRTLPAIPGTRVFARRVPVAGSIDELVETAVDLGPAFSGGLGHAIVVAAPADVAQGSERWPGRVIRWVQSTRIGLDAFVDERSAAGVGDVARRRPAAGRRRGRALARGRHGAHRRRRPGVARARDGRDPRWSRAPETTSRCCPPARRGGMPAAGRGRTAPTSCAGSCSTTAACTAPARRCGSRAGSGAWAAAPAATSARAGVAAIGGLRAARLAGQRGREGPRAGERLGGFDLTLDAAADHEPRPGAPASSRPPRRGWRALRASPRAPGAGVPAARVRGGDGGRRGAALRGRERDGDGARGVLRRRRAARRRRSRGRVRSHARPVHAAEPRRLHVRRVGAVVGRSGASRRRVARGDVRGPHRRRRAATSCRSTSTRVDPPRASHGEGGGHGRGREPPGLDVDRAACSSTPRPSTSACARRGCSCRRASRSTSTRSSSTSTARRSPAARPRCALERLDWEQVAGEWKQVPSGREECPVTAARGAEPLHVPPARGRHLPRDRDDDRRQGPPQPDRLMSLWVAGGEQPPRRDVAQEKVTLIPDKKEYRAGRDGGDPRAGALRGAEGLLTLRRSGLVRTERFRVQGSSHTLRMPHRGRVDVPNVHVQVDLVGTAPRTRDDGEPDPKLPTRPAFASGDDQPLGPAAAAHAAPSPSPRDAALEPGGRTELTLDVKDAAGKPVAGARGGGGRRRRGGPRAHRLQGARPARRLLREARARRGRPPPARARRPRSAGGPRGIRGARFRSPSAQMAATVMVAAADARGAAAAAPPAPAARMAMKSAAQNEAPGADRAAHRLPRARALRAGGDDRRRRPRASCRSSCPTT